MWLKKAANCLDNAISPVIPVFGNIGSVVIALIMLLTVADVVGRRVFNQPVTAAYEVNGLLLVIAVFFTIAHCQFLKGHVTIELVVSRLRQRTQDIIDSALYFFFLVTFGLITRQLWLHALKILKDNVTSGTIDLPVSPFAFVATLGFALLCLVVLAHLLIFLSRAIGK